MNKRVLLTSILSLVLCVSMISGATFALFTSESKTDIAVTSGKVQVQATIGTPELYSPTAIAPDGTLSNDDNAATATNFANGGSASLVKNLLTLDKITPGDKVTFPIAIRNLSNVSSLYRLVIALETPEGKSEAESTLLFSALNFSVTGTAAADTNFNGISYYASAWAPLAAGDDIADLSVTIELPATAGNEYQDLSTSVSFKVEAVQGNAAPAGEATMNKISAATKPADKNGVTLSKDIDVAENAEITPDENATITAVIPGNAIAEDAKSVSIVLYPTENHATITVADNQSADSYELAIIGLKENNDEIILVSLQLKSGLSGLKAYHDGVLMNPVASAEAVVADQDYFYDIATGMLTMATKSFSPFTFVSDNVPVALVTENGKLSITEDMILSGVGNYSEALVLNNSYTFTALDSKESAALSAYAKWNADFVVSFDKEVPAGAIALAGQYTSFSEDWVVFTSEDAIPVGTELRLLALAGVAMNYTELCEYVGTFNCGVAALFDSAIGTTINVELRLFEATGDLDSETENPNYITIGKYSYTLDEANKPTDLPVADVSELADLTNKPLHTQSPYQGDPLTLDVGYVFEATETAEEAKLSPYAKWHADFVVTTDQDVAPNAILLAGQYEFVGTDWIAFSSDETITAGTEIRLLELYGFIANYHDLCNLVKTFRCGAIALDDSASGTTLTVELRLYEAVGEGNGVETGNYVVIGEYDYTF